MSKNDEVLLTQEGVNKIKEEIDHLKNVARKEVADELRFAIAQGDLSENAEYDSAKNKQAFVEGRIIELEGILKNAKIVDDKKIDKDVVQIGNKVEIKNLIGGEISNILITGSTEANPFENKVSYESPIGRSLIGKKSGDITKVDAPIGEYEIEIISIK